MRVMTVPVSMLGAVCELGAGVEGAGDAHHVLEVLEDHEEAAVGVGLVGEGCADLVEVAEGVVDAEGLAGPVHVARSE